MFTPEDNVLCQVCGASATVCLLDKQDGNEHRYCSVHKPPLPVGERHPRLVIERWRLPPDNELSLCLAAPKESLAHQTFRSEMCDDELLGGEGACRYYLSVLTQSDQFVAWSDDFVNNVRRYLVETTCPEAAQFCAESNGIQFLVGFFRAVSERTEGKSASHRATREDRAIEMLLKHPDWTDQQIAKTVPTTVRQLQRWSNFKGLRAAPRRAERRKAIYPHDTT